MTLVQSVALMLPLYVLHPKIRRRVPTAIILQTNILSDLMVGGVPDTPAAASSSSHCSMTSVSNSQSKLFIPFDGAHLLVDVCPRLSETLLARGPRSFFQLGCCQQVPYEGMGGVGGALFY